MESLDATLDTARACINAKRQVEDSLFESLIWNQTVLKVLHLIPTVACDLSPFASLQWEEPKLNQTTTGLGKRRANVTVWINDEAAPKFDSIVEHGFVGWMEAQSTRTGKREWRVALVGDSTLR